MIVRWSLERLVVWLGGAAFVASLGASAYAYGFEWSAADGAAAHASWPAIAINSALFVGFAAHHSLFARDGVKRWLARRVPDRLLRSIYVWTASILWLLLVVWWRPIGGDIFRHTGIAAAGHAIVQLAGIWLIARAAGAIDPLELAGIRQADTSGGLQVRGPYRLVRHPLYLGWMLVVFGAARMTGDRLTFAIVTSLYLVIAIPWEERSLDRAFGDAYRRYKQQVRWRVVPYLY
jgi:protein-S-isoprenylcysteine O-methyltransferase Ste14